MSDSVEIRCGSDLKRPDLQVGFTLLGAFDAFLDSRTVSGGFQELSISEANGNFANKTFTDRTFANGESPWVYWRNSRGCIGESTVDFRQLSRKNMNIAYMSELKLVLLEYIYIIAYTHQCS